MKLYSTKTFTIDDEITYATKITLSSWTAKIRLRNAMFEDENENVND